MSEFSTLDADVFVGLEDNEDHMSTQPQGDFEAKTLSIVSEFRLLSALDSTDEKLMFVGEKLFEKGIVRLKDLTGKSPNDIFCGLDIDLPTKRKFVETVKYFGPYLSTN